MKSLLLGALALALLPRWSEAASRTFATALALVSLVCLGLAWLRFDPGGALFQQIEEVPWVPGLGMAWRLGVEGIALAVAGMSALVFVASIVYPVDTRGRAPAYYAWLLFLLGVSLGVFLALDLLLFYLFFEGGLIPMFLIIGVWGGPRRVYASFKFFLYTLLGSVLMLLAIMAMYWQSGTTDITVLLKYNFPVSMQPWLWFAFFASFAVKMPMWPVHTWLPDAHVQAPTAGSVILAGVLLKLGGYGFLRFSLPMFPEASAQLIWLVFGLSCVAVVVTSLIALVQNDMKKLIAYSSVAHMAIVTIGLFTFNRQGIEGAMMVMLGHGLVSGALFLCVGVIYDRLHTREIDRYGGLAINMPKYAVLFMLFTMASVGLPGTSNFVGELLALMGAYQVSTLVTLIATTGIILGAAYMLYLYRRVVFGDLVKDDVKAMPDLNKREMALLAPLAAVVLWMGVYPESFLAPMRNDVGSILARLAPAAPESDARVAIGKPPTTSAAHAEAHR